MQGQWNGSAVCAQASSRGVCLVVFAVLKYRQLVWPLTYNQS